ncbi:Zinc metalloproteinase nas-15-like protein, partial [Dinothrombium tinctorium]
ITDNGKFIVEGDIILRKHPWIRNIKKASQWPKGIVPYKFRSLDELEEEDIEEITSAMEYIEENSCVRFVKKQPHHKDFVIIKLGTGCNSEVGKQGGAQELVLDPVACMTKGIIIHELMHTLGFLHEQSRDDRDKFVKINSDNIDSKFFDNFDKSSKAKSDHLGEDYDFKSVMHYYYNEFARDKSKASIEPIVDGVNLSDLGESKRLGILSETDKRKLNKFYSCD